MWRIWRVIDPRKAIVLTGLLIAFISTSIHLIQISGDRYNINSWHPDTANGRGGSYPVSERGVAAKVIKARVFVRQVLCSFLNIAPVTFEYL